MEKELSVQKQYLLSHVILENTKKKHLSSGNYYSILIVRVGNCTFYDDTFDNKETPPTVWHCGPNDLILIKPKKSIQLQCRNSQHSAELF